MKKGAVFMAFMAKIQETIARAKEIEMTKDMAEPLEKRAEAVMKILMKKA